MSAFSYTISLFTVIYWIFRVIVAFTASMNIEFIVAPLNLNTEIVLAFITLISIILIFKRSIIGALIYLISHLGYFGVYIYNILQSTTEGVGLDYVNIFISAIGIILPFIVFLDIGLSRNGKKTSLGTRKTDWFFRNEKFDRKYDERADRNQYKF